MADYNVTARFEADATAYIQAVNQAKAATEGLGDSAAKAGKQTGKAFDGADKSVDKTGKAAETASKQTDSLGDSASKAGQETQAAFDGAEAGIEATGASAEAAGASVEGVGQSAAQATQDLQQAFDSAQASVESSAASVEAAKQREIAAIAGVRDAEQQLNAARASGDQDAVIAASARLASAKDEAAAATKDLASAEKDLASASQQAAVAQTQLERATTGFGASMRSAGQFIRDNASDLQTMGTTVATVGAGWAAANAVMAKTGIQYNTLQQVSSKAMETMTGSAEAAAIQMERFHAFADESPFSRATFLEAQQQLMAFGMEAERVVPSLEGIENAVAAIGGGNAEIMQLTDILGAIQGQGKITGRELQRMGQMGIDAADIIGEQMGKSGAAIREEITAGTLDADAAIEALTTGMSQRFEGAAAGLKDTFEGALDRVKAAFRDLSGESFEWAVGSDGGGLFVDLLNHAADFMRAMQELPGPVKNALGIISTLGSTATVAAGGFMLLAPRAVESWDAFVKLSNATGATKLLDNIRTRAPQVGTALRGVGTAAAAAAAGFIALQAIGSFVNQDQVHSVQDLNDALEALANTQSKASIDHIFADWDNTYVPGMKNTGAEINNLDDALDRLANAKRDDGLQLWGDKAFAWTGGAKSEIGQVTEKIEDASDAFAAMVASGDIQGASDAFNVMTESFEASGGSIEDFAGHMDSYIQALKNAAAASGAPISDAEALEWALSGVAPAAIDAAGGLEGLEGAASELDGTLDGVIGKLQTMGLVERNATEAVGALHEAIRDADETFEEYGKNLDVTTEAGYENHQALNSIAESALEAAAAQLELGESGETVAGTLRTGYDAIVDTAQAMGASSDEAEDLARHILEIPDEVSIDTYFDEFAEESARALGNEIEALPEHKVIGIAMQEDGSFYSIQEQLNEFGEPVHVLVDVDGEPVSELRETVMEVNGHEITVYVDDDGTIHRTEEDLEELAQKRPQSTIDVSADTSSAENDLSTTANKKRDSTITGIAKTATAEGNLNTTSRDRDASMTGVAKTIDAEGSLNKTVRDRNASMTGVAYTSASEDALNTTARDRNSSVNATQGSDGVSGWLARLTAPRTVTITAKQVGSRIPKDRGTGGATGGVVGRDFGLAAGGIAGGLATAGLPKLATGGRLPYTGLGTDMILGHNAQGVPTAWVDDGEWVVREQMSRKYHHAIGLINDDHPSVQYLAGLKNGGQAGRERLAASVPYFPPVHLTAPAPQSGPVNLSAGSIQALARAVQPYLVVQDQVIAQANGADAKQGTLAGRF